VPASPVAIPLILERASDSGSPADSVAEVLGAFAGSGEASGKADRKSFPAGIFRFGSRFFSIGSGCQGSRFSSAIRYLTFFDGRFWCFFQWLDERRFVAFDVRGVFGVAGLRCD
jgi:hypothetical protein